MGDPHSAVRFQEAARLDLQEQLMFSQDAFSLRSPTPDTPVPSFQPSSLHHQQAGEGAVAWQWSQFAWINSTIIFINLKAQGAGEDWRKLAFPLVSL